MEKVKTKRVPYLDRIETHRDNNTKMAREVNVYRMRTIEVVDEKQAK